jgi:short-subunit dehydrogenase
MDRVVVITGASAGIGRAAAIAFAKDGARVVLSARNRERLEQAASEIKASGGQALVVPADVTKREEIAALIGAAMREWGAIHVLVNNAAYGLYAPIESMPEAELEALFKTNIYGVLYAIQETLPHMKRQGCGQIINITSTQGRIAFPYASSYCMSKHAIEAMSESLRLEVRPFGIDVIVVGPGLTATDFQKNAKAAGMQFAPARSSVHGVSAEKVARAILRASRRRKRHVYLNFESKLLLFLHGVCPHLTDWAVGRWMRRHLTAGE